MTTNVEQRADRLDVNDLIARLGRTTDPHEIEELADRLGPAGDRRAIRPLLSRLGDGRVQADTDSEDAVCRALMALDVMRSCGNLSFCLRPRQDLPDDVVGTIRELAGVIPWRYFGTPRL